MQGRTHSHTASWTASDEDSSGKRSSRTNLECRTDPLLLPVIAVVVVPGLRAYQESISTLGTDHASLTLCLYCFCGKWMQLREEERGLFRLWFPMQVVNIKSISSSSFNPSHPHILSSHHTHHILSRSLSRRRDRLPLRSRLNGQSRKPIQNLGKGRKDPSL
jgi:hypothetical protein